MWIGEGRLAGCGVGECGLVRIWGGGVRIGGCGLVRVGWWHVGWRGTGWRGVRIGEGGVARAGWQGVEYGVGEKEKHRLCGGAFYFKLLLKNSSK